LKPKNTYNKVCFESGYACENVKNAFIKVAQNDALLGSALSFQKIAMI
jgi:hypothetical protein